MKLPDFTIKQLVFYIALAAVVFMLIGAWWSRL